MPTNFIQNIFSTPRTHTVFPNCDDHVETIGLKIVGAGPYLLVWLHLESLGVQIFRKKVVTWWSWTRDQTISFPSWITQGPRTSLHLWTISYFCDLILEFKLNLGNLKFWIETVWALRATFQGSTNALKDKYCKINCKLVYYCKLVLGSMRSDHSVNWVKKVGCTQIVKT